MRFLLVFFSLTLCGQQIDWVKQVKNKPIIDVRDYGVKGDGSNDLTAFQAALTAGAGKEVFVPAGTYTINGTLTISSGTVLRGSGIGVSSIVATHATANLFTLTSISDASIRDLKITGPTKTSGYAIALSSTNRTTVKDVLIYQFPFGVSISGGSITSLDNVEVREFKATSGIGVLISGGAIEVRLHAVIMDNATGAQPLTGIQVKYSPYTQIDRCEVIRSGTGLLVNPGTGENVTDLNVSNSLFDAALVNPIRILPTGTGYVDRARFNNVWASGAGFGEATGGDGVYIGIADSAFVSHTVFRGLTAVYNRQHGVNIQGGLSTYDTLIENSLIYGNSVAPSVSGTYSGILIGQNVGTLRIANNQLGTTDPWYGTQNSGIYLAPGGAGDYITIVGNMIPGSTFTPIYGTTTGVSKIIKDNIPASTTKGTITSATSVTLSGAPFEIYDITGTTPIATITEGWLGRRILLTRATAGSVDLVTGGNIGSAKTLAQGQSLVCAFDAIAWLCVGP
jgi:hypothetical protein